MEEGRIRILLVEDDSADAYLVTHRLQGDPGYRLERVATLRDALERLALDDEDVLLLDLQLPDSSGIETVVRIRESAAEIPIVVLTGSGDDPTALGALQAGAQDYVVKHELNYSVLRRAIRYAIERQRLFQRNRRLEESLRRAEKYESLSVLADGIAHDFNNLLTVILSNTEMLRPQVPTNGGGSASLEAIAVSARVAAKLVFQLLEYSGKGRLSVEPIDLSSRIREIEGILKEMIPDKVEFRMRLAADLPAVEADASQLQQLAMNLVLNAAESIGDAAGFVEVVSASIELSAEEIEALTLGDHLEAGRFVSLTVSDSGSGMDEATLAKIFDPFFTTKFPGRGLGLASTLGIVRRHGGGLHVKSNAGAGTTFNVYLAASAALVPATGPRSSDLSGEGVLLVVDDNPAVCEIAQHSLESYGYSVLVAESGARGVEIFRERTREIDLVLLDLTMPGRDGTRTLAEIRRLKPDIKVILWSGHDAERASRKFPSGELAGFLQKPFGPEELAARVRDVLAES